MDKKKVKMMMNDLQPFLDDVSVKVEDHSPVHGEAYNNVDLYDFLEIQQRHDRVLCIGLDLDPDDKTIVDEFLSTLDHRQRLMFLDILEKETDE
jgi:hypothetical protein